MNEALLEMFFFHPISEYFQTAFGAFSVKVFKPTPQQEVWVGFDQGWYFSTLTEADLFRELRDAIQMGEDQVEKLYLGFFLQFKVVQKRMRRSETTPPGWRTPYLQVPLSLEPSNTTGLSQHHTLVRLAEIQNTAVAYACPMVFTSSDIYRGASLNLLRCVLLDNAPPGWKPGESHFIAFRDTMDPSPSWCSEPVEGRALPFKEWASPKYDERLRLLSGQEVIDLIGSVRKHIRQVAKSQEWTIDEQEILPQSFTIVELRRRS